MKANHNFNDIVTDIYKSYMQAKPHFVEKLDKYNRNPNMLIQVAQKLQIIPPKENIIKITGSKGKGTTSRIIFSILKELSNKKTALITSPEEIEHNDRIAVGDNFISKDDFIRIYFEIKPLLDDVINNFKHNYEYLSPSGIFLIIGLYYFKEQGVEQFVIETGRGCQFDEAGIIDSKISTITSVFLEHPEYLGNIEEITKNKSFCIQNSDFCIINQQILHMLEKYNISRNNCEIINDNINIPTTLCKQLENHPNWYKTNFINSCFVVAKFLNKSVDEIIDSLEFWQPSTVASFGVKQIENINIFYEPCISTKSIDENMLGTLKNTLFIASFPDEKDIESITEKLNHFGDVRHIVLNGTRGYLVYDKTKQMYEKDILFECEYCDEKTFKQKIDNLTNNTKYDNIYFIGTHTYIRLVKKSVFNYKV